MDSRAETLAGDKERSVSPSPLPSFIKEKIDSDDQPTDNEGSLMDPATPVEEEDVDYPTGAKMLAVVVALCLSIFLVALDMTIIATAIPKITDEFHGLELVGWYGSAFFLTVGAFQSTWGKAYKYFPLKISFLLSIFVFELGSLICGVAPNSTALIVGRAIAGLGGAGIASGAYTLIAFSVPPPKRPAFTGLMGASYGIASVIGPLLGGVFAEKATWRWCFYINLPIGGVSAIIIFIFFKAPAHAKPQVAPLKEKVLQMDLPGASAILAAIICYVLALQWGGQSKSWRSADVIGLLVGFVLFIVVFVVIEYFQGERAMVVPRLLKDRTIWVGVIFTFFLGACFFILIYYLPIYFQVVSGVSASQSGVRNLPLILGCTIATILSGALITVWGHYVPLMILGSIMAAIGSGLIYTLGLHSSSGEWIGYQALTGLGIGLGLQIPIISAQACVGVEDISSVTAMILFFQTIGGALWVSAGQVAFTNILIQKLPSRAPGIDPMVVVATGVTEIRATFAAADVQGIVLAYMDGLKVAYALSIGCGCVAVLVCACAKWTNLKGKVVAGGAA